MTGHKFRTGQAVELRPQMGVWLPSGSFTVVRQLPSNGQQNQYRLKSTKDGQERVAAESELTPTRV